MRFENLRRIRGLLIVTQLGGVLGCVLGCGQGDQRVQRYSLSGTVTFEGQLVPAGWIVLSPESGPGASADLVDGRFTTPKDYGTVGGLHKIEITAMEGVPGLDPNDEGASQKVGQIFTCIIQRDIPKEAATIDIRLTHKDIGAKAGQVRF